MIILDMHSTRKKNSSTNKNLVIINDQKQQKDNKIFKEHQIEEKLQVQEEEQRLNKNHIQHAVSNLYQIYSLLFASERG